MFSHGHATRNTFCFTFNDNDFYAMPYAPCALRYFEATMPAIASIEDLKAAQKDVLETKENDDL